MKARDDERLKHIWHAGIPCLDGRKRWFFSVGRKSTSKSVLFVSKRLGLELFVLISLVIWISLLLKLLSFKSVDIPEIETTCPKWAAANLFPVEIIETFRNESRTGENGSDTANSIWWPETGLNWAEQNTNWWWQQNRVEKLVIQKINRSKLFPLLVLPDNVRKTNLLTGFGWKSWQAKAVRSVLRDVWEWKMLTARNCVVQLWSAIASKDGLNCFHF